MIKPDAQATEITRRRYQRLARMYDLMELLTEKRFLPWHKLL